MIETFFQPYNNKIENLLLRYGLKKMIEHPFEMELPYFIQDLLLNLSCDMTLERALGLALKNYSGYLNTNEDALDKQSSLNILNKLAIECNAQNLWKLSRLINQNYITGSQSTYFAIEKFHDELWQKKLQSARIKSEKASIALTFLLMLSLISIIVVIISPIVINQI